MYPGKDTISCSQFYNNLHIIHLLKNNWCQRSYESRANESPDFKCIGFILEIHVQDVLAA